MTVAKGVAKGVGTLGSLRGWGSRVARVGQDTRIMQNFEMNVQSFPSHGIQSTPITWRDKVKSSSVKLPSYGCSVACASNPASMAHAL